MGVYDGLNRLAGWVDCRVTGAEPAAFLNGCAGERVPVLGAAAEGEYALRVRLRARDSRRAARLARRTQCTLEILSGGGTPALLRFLRRRGLAAAGLGLILLLLAWSRLFIWEIGVTGNERVDTGRILDALRECGISCGSFWPGITSDNLRSRLLTELPELAWATVNVYGSRAEVIVRERVPKPDIWYEKDPVDVVAAKTGFVTEVRTLCGTARVGPGSAVTEGETLISCHADSLWGGPRLVHATGTVRAETWYVLRAAVPLSKGVKQYTGRESSRWALLIGKQRYNFYLNSSISGGMCDRISKVWHLRLGGVFSLPVALVRETEREYAVAETPRDQNLARRELEELLLARLQAALGPEAEIRDVRCFAAVSDGLLSVKLHARCSEDIGVERPGGEQPLQ